MNSAQKPLTILVATLVPLFAPTVMAAGLSDLIVHSALGEPLRAEIRLSPSAGETLDPSCFRIVSQPASADDLPWIRNARVSISGDRLRITTREPISHPLAMLGVRVACGVEFQRDYPLLLQPPMARTATPDINLPTAEAPARSTGSRNATTVRKLPRSGAAAGGRAERSSAAQPRPHGATAKAAATKTKPPRGDRLVISRDKAQSLRLEYQLSHPQAANTAPAPEGPVAKPTLSTYDESVTAQLELDEKIKRLEEYQTVLRKRIAELDQLAATVQVQNAPPSRPQPSAAAAPAESAPNWFGLFAGGVVAVAAGGLALLWMRSRRSEAPPLELDTQLPDEPGFSGIPDSEVPVGVKTAPHQPAPPVAAQPIAAQPVAAQPVPAPAPQSYAPPSQMPDESMDWEDPTFTPPHPIPFDETVDEQDSALELAEIMMSFGRTQGAAETLADYIRSNPRQAVKPWIKLLDVYHVAGMRAEFEALTRQLNKTFNVKTITWDDFKATRNAPDSVEQMGHVIQQLQELWGTQEAQVYIHQLLRDNRNGTRQGFPLCVVEELLLLLAVLDDTLGTYRPNTELTLADMEARPSSKAA